MYLKNLEKKFEYHIRKLYKRIVRLEKVVFNINNNFNSIKTSSLNEKLNVCNNKRDTINSEKNKE
jgi:ferritin-like metal-binding protein YciE